MSFLPLQIWLSLTALWCYNLLVCQSSTFSRVVQNECEWDMSLGNETYRVDFSPLKNNKYSISLGEQTATNTNFKYNLTLVFSFCGDYLKCDNANDDTAAVYINSTVISSTNNNNSDSDSDIDASVMWLNAWNSSDISNISDYNGCVSYGKWEDIEINMTLTDTWLNLQFNTSNLVPSILGQSVCNTSCHQCSENTFANRLKWGIDNNTASISKYNVKDGKNVNDYFNCLTYIDIEKGSDSGIENSQLWKDIAKCVKLTKEKENDNFIDSSTVDLIVLLVCIGLCVIGTCTLSFICCRNPNKNKYTQMHN